MSRRRKKSSSLKVNTRRHRRRLMAIAGLITIGLAIAWYFIQTSKKSDQPRIEVKYSDGGAETIREILNLNSFDTLQQVAGEVLARLSDKTVEDRISLLRILDATARRRMEIGVTGEQRDLGLHDHLVATQALALAAEGTVTIRIATQRELVQLGQAYRDHANPKVAREAYVCLILAQGFDSETSEADFDSNAAINLIGQLAEKFPDDAQILKAIEDMLERFAKYRADQLAPLVQAIVATYGQSSRPEIVKWARLLREKQLMAERGIVELVSAVANGEDSKVPLIVETTQELLKSNPTDYAIARSLELAQFLESIQRIGEAESILQRCGEILESDSSNPEWAEVRDLHRRFTARLGLKGHDLMGTALCLDGRTLNAETIKDLVVVFYVVNQGKQVQAAKQFAKSLERFQPHGVRLVVIATEEAPERLLTEFTPNDPFVYLLAAQDPEQPFMLGKTFTYFPATMILNRGKFAETAVLEGQISLRLDAILFPNK